MKRSLQAWLFVLLLTCPVGAREVIQLPNNPALSPDGQWLAFDWNGDLWLAPAAGGEARQRTAYLGRDAIPRFSPDGKEIAFVSDREGSLQIFSIPVDGGIPRQLTFHTAGSLLQEWTPDGNLLIKATRDHFWRQGDRFFLIDAKKRAAEKLLFDDYGSDGVLSPDGKKLLFTREGEAWWRKGYKGSRVTQVWLYDLDAKSFTKILHQEFGARWPLWKPDGKGFYFVAEHARGSNLASYDFATKSAKQLTNFPADSVVFPCVARNGSKVVFRHLFDLYAYDPTSGTTSKLDLYHTSDRGPKKAEYRTLTSATSAAFSNDGLEIAFIAGGDLWIMDTELREPRQITRTATDESSPLFAPDGQSLYVTQDHGSEFHIMKVTRKNPKQFWWQNSEFDLQLVLAFQARPSHFKFSPDGKKLAYAKGLKGLYVLDLGTREDNAVVSDWSISEFDWSPDSKWLVYSRFDEDFNRDIWLFPADKKGKPFNVSRHPFSEYDPVFSPDGKMLAFAGRRASGDAGAHVCLVYLNPEDDEKTARDRKLQKALDKMKSRTPGGPGKEPAKPAMPTEVSIAFEGLHDRVKRVNLGDGAASSLFWSPDSKKLAFTGTFEGKPGTFAIDIGDTLTPKLLTPVVGSNPAWLKTGNQIVWLVNGVPTSTPGVASAAPSEPAAPSTTLPKKGIGKLPSAGLAGPAAAPGGGFTFSVRQKLELPARNAAIFDTCWRIMRDHWYDSKLGNNDWDQVRKKYRPLAEAAPDPETVTTAIQMMLGELNGSHLGFTMNPTTGPASKSAEPRDATGHLGVRFDLTFAGPGLKVRDVLPGSPAEKKRSRLVPGDVVLEIDGTPVNRDTDLTLVLNGPADREVKLAVKSAEGTPREVLLRPISYTAAQGLLYEHWLAHNRKLVEQGSKGAFGYLHISAMAMPNFKKFEEELVSQGSGKDGLVIDVRENPGGSITDHLLTALTQPAHAITVPRGGVPGYPLDRKVYISWSKPIVVLCNQNSGSNAEIFSHAIKTLKRGQVVGVATAGAVVSTGVAPVMDVGTLRLPTRGWFTLNDGEDMEKNGAVPHHVVWLDPGTLPQGNDAQLQKALEVLSVDVQAWRARPQPKLRLSTDRP